MKAATGLVQGRRAEPALAEAAVRIAMERAGLEHPQAVILCLSADFAHDPQAALAAATRAAHCLQVCGCTAAGVFTEEDWVLDAPAAAALVLGEGAGLRPPQGEGPMFTEIFTLTAPSALDLHWLTQSGPRFGGVSGDATGTGPYSVWAGGRVQDAGRCELEPVGFDLRIGVSQGIRPLSKPAVLDAAEGSDLLAVGGETALSSLTRELPLSMRAPDRIPTHLLMAGIPYGDPAHALEEGRFHLLPIISVNKNNKSVSVAGEPKPGSAMFWALRQPQAAEHDMRAMLRRLSDDGSNARPNDQPPPPAFGLMFASMERGPACYGGEDRDLQALKKQFPGMPLIGFYGNNEIAHRDGANRLLQYSVVLGLGYANVPELTPPEQDRRQSA